MPPARLPHGDSPADLRACCKEEALPRTFLRSVTKSRSKGSEQKTGQTTRVEAMSHSRTGAKYSPDQQKTSERSNSVIGWRVLSATRGVFRNAKTLRTLI